MSAGVFINVLVALAACAFAIGGFIVDPTFVWIAVPIQIGGGLAYRAGQEFEPGPDTLLRRVWLLQIVILFMLGSALTVESSLAAGRISDPFAALLWLILGYIFVIGMLIYDALGRRWLRMAQLDADEL
jgi:hypothetical protein